MAQNNEYKNVNEEEQDYDPGQTGISRTGKILF